MDLNIIFEKCKTDVGGTTNEDINWYLNGRPNVTSRKSFFEEAVGAIWASGMKRKSRDTFLKNAEKNGFSWNFVAVSSWDNEKFQQFIEKLHGEPVPKYAAKKWKAIHNLAIKLNDYSTEEDFRKSFFKGKVQSSYLDKIDVQQIVNLKLPFIGEANASYIIRNMGGEAIKCDRWIAAFLQHYHMSLDGLDGLEMQLQRHHILLGMFDIVIWAYCEKFVKKVSEFETHFNRAFP